MAYTEPVKFSSVNTYGRVGPSEDDVYTVDAFKELCANGAFIDYDGYGHAVKDNLADHSVLIKPSTRWIIPKDATHVVWYNR